VAHDFNNLLTAIAGYCELTLMRLGEDPLRRNIEEIQKATERAAALTQQLLAFSRKQVLAPRILDPTAIVARMEGMLKRLIGEDIELATPPGPGTGRIKADQGQIEQVILNLALNARDAMPQGGRLVIETANVDLDDAYARRHAGVNPGPYVMLSVSDSGSGMDGETQRHIFEPYFTTKEQGKGTGLGLSTVYGIIAQSGGNIWVYSEPGEGTSFKIYLPRVEEGASTSEAPAPPAGRPVGTETILLVEDDGLVREVARQTLEISGYTVLPAQDGEDAVLVAGRHPGSIHLMVTDVVMPRMSGRELVERLGPLRPEMKVLYVSGYTEDAIVQHGMVNLEMAFLQKPFALDALARKVREVLDAPGYEPR